MARRARPVVQLVFQLHDDFFAGFDALVAFEDRLIESMSRNARVDGHDLGGGLVNFFVHTCYPEAAFRAFLKHMGTRTVKRSTRVAYIALGADGPHGEWTELWPKKPRRGQLPFSLLGRATEHRSSTS